MRALLSGCGELGLLSSCGGFSCCLAQALRARASGVVAQLLQSPALERSSILAVPGLSCSWACGIFLTQGSNPCLLHWWGVVLYCWATREAICWRSCSLHTTPYTVPGVIFLKDDSDRTAPLCWHSAVFSPRPKSQVQRSHLAPLTLHGQRVPSSHPSIIAPCVHPKVFPPVFLPRESHGQRSLMGYSPRVAGSDTTEWLTLCSVYEITLLH